jgi:hypothetical protein
MNRIIWCYGYKQLEQLRASAFKNTLNLKINMSGNELTGKIKNDVHEIRSLSRRRV